MQNRMVITRSKNTFQLCRVGRKRCFTKYVKITFFKGARLKPLPLGLSKDMDVRYLDIYEDEGFDKKQFTNWIKQASKIEGWMIK